MTIVETRDLKRDNAAYQMGKADKVNGKPKKTLVQFKLAIGGTIDADDYPLYEAGYAADRDDLDFDPDAKNGPLVPGKETKPSKADRWAQELINRAGVCTGPGPCDTSIIGTGKNWVTKVGGLPAYIRAVAHALLRSGHSETDAIKLAVGTVHRWAAGGGGVSKATRARAAAALAEWEAKKAKADASRYAASDEPWEFEVRQMVGEWGAGGPPTPDATDAASLLPVAPVPKRPKPREATMIGPHAFRGSDLSACSKCGKPASDRVHLKNRSADDVEVRHRGKEGHIHAPSGHAVNPVKATARLKARARALQDAHIPAFESTMKDVFDRQERATLSRLTGKRGKRALRDLQLATRASQQSQKQPQQPPQPPPPAIAGPALSAASGVASGLASEGALVAKTAAAAGKAGFVAGAAGGALFGAALTGLPSAVREIFDPDFWQAKTAEAVAPLYHGVAASVRAETLRQLGLKPPSGPATVWEDTDTPQGEVKGVPRKPAALRDSLAQDAVRNAIMSRPNQLAGNVTDTTYKAIQHAMAEGLAAKESPPQIATRIRQVFTEARGARARMIARTEVHSALNAAATAYAEHLPPGTVGGKQWLSLHDDRVRPTHAAADGQVRPLGSPFYVGGFPAMHPGDPMLPPNESINCRCSLAFVSPSEAAKHGVITLAPLTEAS